MLRAIVTVIALLGAGIGAAQERDDLLAPLRITSTAEIERLERWQCFSTSDFSKTKILVRVGRYKRIDTGREFGVVAVAGTTRLSSFKVDGFDRRWDFDSYEYAFMIKPDGTGAYYDFSGETETARPSQFYKCVMG